MVNPFKNQRTSAMSFNDSKTHRIIFLTAQQGERHAAANALYFLEALYPTITGWHKDLSQVWSLRLQRLNGHSNLLDPTNGSGLYGLAWPDSWSLLLLLPYKKAEETAEQMGVYGVSQSCDASQMRIVSWFCLENASRLMTSVWQITSLVFVCTSDSCRCITFPFWLLPGCSIFCITACGWHSARISFEEAESAEQAGHHVFMFLPKNLNQKMLCILALPVPFEAGAEA